MQYLPPIFQCRCCSSDRLMKFFCLHSYLSAAYISSFSRPYVEKKDVLSKNILS